MMKLKCQFFILANFSHKVGHPELVDSSLALAQAYASTGLEEAEGAYHYHHCLHHHYHHLS